MGVMPDVVFYEVSGTTAYGIRRISSSNSYWHRCELFQLAPTRVEYWDERDLAALDKIAQFSDSIAFAKRHCRNFQAAK